MLTVVCWKWKPVKDYRSTYEPDTVNVLRRMVKRHYPDPHRFVCVTDDDTGITEPGVDIVPIWNDFADLLHPHNNTHPSCYRRLKAFAPEAREIFGKRFVSVDLDCVITDDLRPVWNRPEDFVCWGGTHVTTSYNGSMFLMTAGSRAKVWTDFNPEWSPKNARQAGHYGSDQAWISYCLGPNEKRWNQGDGVYSYRLDVAPRGLLPVGARIVFFNGKHDPWGPEPQKLEWVVRHYR